MNRFICSVALLALAGCATSETHTPTSTGSTSNDFQPDARPIAQTYVYECTGMDFMTRVGPGEMAIWLEDRYLVLSQVRAASGSKYVEGDVMFWSKGHDVLLEVDGIRYSDCSLNPQRAPWEDARRRGVDFRAVGNEPGWVVEVRDGQNILFKGDYGATVLLFPDPAKSATGNGSEYTAQSGKHSLRLTIEDAFCADTMADIEYPTTVQLVVDGRSYAGCGRELDYPWE
ncbi:hypothetical protein A3709_12345 [Halioglobus sp. HI00S01]|uniref:COG3650 family protein n=1 Tax=Halioglobus sp. HI00S01 TaxID=1822214 RepID=UPI0007C31DDE|nr:MliC family protein [Halioglobus sp. HI00S01]KZX60372.1 hypothetical protein A3709_12345 [Halioglobus sp. HI00S01]